MSQCIGCRVYMHLQSCNAMSEGRPLPSVIRSINSPLLSEQEHIIRDELVSDPSSSEHLTNSVFEDITWSIHLAQLIICCCDSVHHPHIIISIPKPLSTKDDQLWPFAWQTGHLSIEHYHSITAFVVTSTDFDCVSIIFKQLKASASIDKSSGNWISTEVVWQSNWTNSLLLLIRQTIENIYSTVVHSPIILCLL